MKEKFITALLTKFLTEANIKLSLPVILVAFIAVITFQTIQIGRAASEIKNVKEEIFNTKSEIKSTTTQNNMILFEFGQEILGTWVNKMAESQKTIVDYMKIPEREKKLINKNIDTGTQEVIEKAKQKQYEIQYMIKKKYPDSLKIKSRPLNLNSSESSNDFSFIDNEQPCYSE